MNVDVSITGTGVVNSPYGVTPVVPTPDQVPMFQANALDLRQVILWVLLRNLLVSELIICEFQNSFRTTTLWAMPIIAKCAFKWFQAAGLLLMFAPSLVSNIKPPLYRIVSLANGEVGTGGFVDYTDSVTVDSTVNSVAGTSVLDIKADTTKYLFVNSYDVEETTFNQEFLVRDARRLGVARIWPRILI